MQDHGVPWWGPHQGLSDASEIYLLGFVIIPHQSRRQQWFKVLWSLLHPEEWVEISAPALNISILQMREPVKSEVCFWCKMENLFTVQAEILTVYL